MGISVSYTGGGRQSAFSIDGVPASGSVEAEILGAAPSHPTSLFPGMADAVPMRRAPSLPQMPEFPSMADDADKGKVKMGEGDFPDFLERKVAPNGSIAVQGNQLQLKGDESCGGGHKMYGSVGGNRGFFTFQQYDPGGGGMMLSGGGDTADGSNTRLDGNTGGATARIGGRTYIYTDITIKDRPALVVKQFWRLAQITPNGRIISISQEYEEEILRHPLGGNGKYGVRLIYDADEDDPIHPIPRAFAFGAEADLDTYDEDTEKFKCNYDANDQPLDDPPVKVIATLEKEGEVKEMEG